MPAVFVAVVLMMSMLAGCGSSKGFRVALETGGDADQKTREAAEQQTFSLPTTPRRCRKFPARNANNSAMPF
jgi:hypothetical protein